MGIVYRGPIKGDSGSKAFALGKAFPNQSRKSVDDDKNLLASMKALFESNGFDIEVTISCDEGFSTLKSFKPDLIFLGLLLSFKSLWNFQSYLIGK